MEKEIHGPLNEFQYGVTSHSMMVGGGSGTYRTVRWEKDGRVTLTEEQNGSGVAKTKVYEIDPEAAQKIRDFVEEENVAALSKVEVPSLYRPLDSCTTSSLRMEFDDREVGGLPYVVRNVFCGLAGGFFRQLEERVAALLKACLQTGTLVRESTEPFGLMPGGMTPGGTMPDGMTPGGKKPEGNGGPKNTHAKGAGDPAAEAEAWTCPACGNAGNTGRFCPECGSPRP